MAKKASGEYFIKNVPKDFFLCEHCGKAFDSQIAAIGHERNKHGVAHPKVKRGKLK